MLGAIKKDFSKMTPSEKAKACVKVIKGSAEFQCSEIINILTNAPAKVSYYESQNLREVKTNG